MSVKLFLEASSPLVVDILLGGKESKKDNSSTKEKNSERFCEDIEAKETSDIDDDLDASESLVSDAIIDVKKNGLPKFQDLVTSQWGLCDVLRRDKFCILNLHYESDIAVAYRVLQPLVNGDIPDQVKNEGVYLS